MITFQSLFCQYTSWSTINPAKFQGFLQTLKQHFTLGGDLNIKHTAFGRKLISFRDKIFHITQFEVTTFRYYVATVRVP